MTADISEAALRQRLGAADVVTDTISLGEGESELGTVLYPDQPARRLEVLWVDSGLRTRPRIIYVRGDSSAWRLFPGVGIGTSLTTLDSINGRPISLFGFGWDYGGTTSAYNGGRLDSLWGEGAERVRTVRLRLAPDSRAPESLLTQVAGDREFSSNHPAMRALNPRVYQMLIAPRSDNPLDLWLGQWNGPEGTFLVLSKKEARYHITIQSLDGPASYDGRGAGDHIEFERNGKTESIRATNGQGTGMKWLLDKTNCLTINPGEGFCRD